MTTWLALLRGINVGGQKMVAMSDLREIVSDLRFSDVQSVLQSGNLVFRGDARSDADLERLLEAEAGKRLGLETHFFIRSAEEWRDVVRGNPFRREAESDPAHLVVLFLKEAPGAGNVRALQKAITGREVVRAEGRHAYVVYPDGQGKSRLTNALIERSLGTRVTARNWNTVLKLHTLATT